MRSPCGLTAIAMGLERAAGETSNGSLTLGGKRRPFASNSERTTGGLAAALATASDPAGTKRPTAYTVAPSAAMATPSGSIDPENPLGGGSEAAQRWDPVAASKATTRPAV